jgi:hypothetical protein
MSKRKLDVYITPPDIKRQRKQLKVSWKENILASGGSLALKFDKSSSSPTLPTAVEKYLNPLNSYISKTNSSKQIFHVLRNQKTYIEETIMKPIGTAYIEAVIITPQIWILITQISVFYTERRDIDACAIDAPYYDPTKFEIKTNECKFFNKPFNELIIQDGVFQLLVTGAEYGNFMVKVLVLFLDLHEHSLLKVTKQHYISHRKQ